MKMNALPKSRLLRFVERAMMLARRAVARFLTRYLRKRKNLTIQQLKSILLVDTVNNAILDVHVTTTWKHDTQIAPQVVKRNVHLITVLTGTRDTTARNSGDSPMSTIFDHISSTGSLHLATKRGMRDWAVISIISRT